METARSGNDEKMMSLLTPLNVNCHASDGRKVGKDMSYMCMYCCSYSLHFDLINPNSSWIECRMGLTYQEYAD